MSSSQIEIDSEVSRIRAALVNSGLHSFIEAEQKLALSTLSLTLGDEAAATPAGQAALLTAVVTGARCFGKVITDCPKNQLLLLSLPLGVNSLLEAAIALGAQPSIAPSICQKVLIGDAIAIDDSWLVQANWDGWTAGVAPGKNPVTIGRGDCALAGVAAGALAVGQAFLREQGDPRAGITAYSISLWTPELGADVIHHPGPESKDVYLPTGLWMVGLGNLGQAYIWSTTMLPYPKANEVVLFLQDDDLIGRENWGTSVLVQRGRYGALKTRIAEEWVTARGFQVRRIDRRLDASLRRFNNEPGIAVVGLDRMPARCLLGEPGFDYIIDAGLGATFSDYQKFRINVFDTEKSPAEHFEGIEDQADQRKRELLKLPAYQELADSRGDSGCGAAMLAESSVAVPFVSALVGALAITQAIRIASGQAPHNTLTGDACDLRTVRAVLGKPPLRTAITNVLAAS